MKKCILSLIAICSIYAATAQSCISVQQVSTNYATKQITFDLKWGTCNNTNHLYRVWVFVDYREVTNAAKGAWSRAAIAAADTGTPVSANNGVWITGTANATQRVTLTLNVSSTKFDWCAIATDYPPNINGVSGGAYTLRGTQTFKVNGSAIAGNQTSNAISSLTDATGCEGCMAIRDFKFSGSNVSIPCCPNLTAVNGYCRDLAADNALKMLCNGMEYEVKLTNVGPTSWAPNTLCPAGWVWPSPATLKCMWVQRAATGISGAYWSNSTTGYEHNCDNDNNTPTATALFSDGCAPCCTLSQNVPAGLLARAWANREPADGFYVRCVR